MAKNIEVRILGDAKPLQRSLNGASRNVKEFEGHVGKASRGALSASGAFSHLGRSVAYASGAFLGAAGFTSVLKQSVEHAMDLHREMEKTSAVFGKSGRQVSAWAQTTAKAFGIARNDALQSANQFGQLFKAMGVGDKQALKMSTSLTELSAKLALFAGKSPEEASAALGQALAGRARALRAYGIVIDSVTVKAEAMRLGLIKTTVSSQAVEEAQTKLSIAVAKAAEAHKKYGANTTQVASADLAVQKAHDALAKATSGVSGQMSNAAKAQATYSLIQQQSTAATKVWNREQGSAEVQLKKVKAELKDTETTIGNALLPTVTKYSRKLADWLGQSKNQKTIQHDVNKAVQTASDIVKAATPIVKGIADGFKLFAKEVGGTKHAFEILFGLAIVAKLRSIAIGLGLQGGGVAGGAAVATRKVGLLGKALTNLPAKITIAIILVPTVYGGLKKFFQNQFGADFSGVSSDAQGTGGNPYPVGTINYWKWRGANGKPGPGAHATSSEKQAYQQGKKHPASAASGAGAAGALVGKGVSGPVTAGISAIERDTGGHVNDDYATSGHASNSYHYKGQAIDFAPDAGVWAKLYRNRGMFAELFGPTRFAGGGLYHYGVQFYDAALQKQHQNHIHVAYTGGPAAIDKALRGGGSGGGGGGSGGGGSSAAGTRGGSGGGGSSTLHVGKTPKKPKKPKKPVWQGATAATIISAKASVKAMLTSANEALGGIAGPMDDVERNAEAHLAKLKAHLHPHMSATDLARTKADIAVWGKVLKDEIAKQTSLAARAFRDASASVFRAFDAATDAHNRKFQRETDDHLRVMQASFTKQMAAFDRETQRGLNALAAPAQTPTEALLASRQAAKDAADLQQALQDALTSGDPKAIADARYNIETAALEAQAQAERTAADAQAQAAQDAYSQQRSDLSDALNEQERLKEQSYQDGRDEQQRIYDQAREDQRIALQDQLDDWNTNLDDKKKSWAAFWAWIAANGGGPSPVTDPSVGGSGGGSSSAGHSSGGLHIKPMAAGGPVRVGRDYLIGERGPELFSPGVSGRITPLGSGTTTNVFNIPNYVGDKRELVDIVTRELYRLQKRNGTTGIK